MTQHTAEHNRTSHTRELNEERPSHTAELSSLNNASPSLQLLHIFGSIRQDRYIKHTASY